MNSSIAGKVIVVTGASSGMGEAAARYLSEQGAHLVIGARRANRIEKLATDLIAKGANVIPVAIDVTRQADVQNLVDTAVKSFGRIDVLINNAGVMPLSPLENLQIEEWNYMIDVNVRGVLYGIAAALPYMKEQKFGHIITTASVAAHKVFPTAAVYSATKFAVHALMEGLRLETKPYNIRTTSVSPGAVVTELHQNISNEDIRAANQKYAKNFGISAESFARVVAFAIAQPFDVDVNEIIFRPTSQEL